MPLSPAPLMPGLTPLPEPGRRPPDRRALRIGALVAIPTLIVGLVIGHFALIPLAFLMPGLQAQASSDTGAANGSGGGSLFQGYVDSWSRKGSNGGFTTPASLTNMESQVRLFHMNTVVIPVIADMPSRDGSELDWHSSDQHSVNTLPESDYVQAVKDAISAGMVPILELEVRQEDQNFPGSDSSQLVGTIWSQLDHSQYIGGETNPIGQLEQDWFDNYTAFAVEYATISRQYHLPYFIIGDSLTNVAYDTDKTNATADPGGVTQVPGENFPGCASVGRRDCEWRHVIHAVHSQTYDTLDGHQSQAGGNYTGKLIYIASWNGASGGDGTDPEFEKITWWDAVDIIGIDAYFPLFSSNADVGVNDLMNAWRGVGQGLGGEKDIYGRITAVQTKFGRPVALVAGYASSSGANNDPSNLTGGTPDGGADQQEQLNDMQALLQTFGGAGWWDGVFWNGDAPVAPRATQSNWATNSNWAGDTLATSKSAGQYLNKYWSSSPLPLSH
ncbi:MAG TPA: hypothetical protein VMV29_03535 [Ktedonobacterales bacterium]|nr:hypothetical protein [Ktedonobacterales bacterium]